MSERNQLSDDNISLSGLGKTIRKFSPSIFRVLFIYVGCILHVQAYDTHRTRNWTAIRQAPLITMYQMVVEFNKISKKAYAEIIDQLNMLASSGSSKKLANELRFSDEAARKILYYLIP